MKPVKAMGASDYLLLADTLRDTAKQMEQAGCRQQDIDKLLASATDLDQAAERMMWTDSDNSH